MVNSCFVHQLNLWNVVLWGHDWVKWLLLERYLDKETDPTIQVCLAFIEIQFKSQLSSSRQFNKKNPSMKHSSLVTITIRMKFVISLRNNEVYTLTLQYWIINHLSLCVNTRLITFNSIDFQSQVLWKMNLGRAQGQVSHDKPCSIHFGNDCVCAAYRWSMNLLIRSVATALAGGLRYLAGGPYSKHCIRQVCYTCLMHDTYVIIQYRIL